MSRSGLKRSIKRADNPSMRDSPPKNPIRKSSGPARMLMEETGSALIEFCVFMPLVVFMFLAAVDYSLITQQSMMVADAATIGSRFAAVAGNGSNTTGMVAAAKSAAVGVPNFAVTAVNYCTCSAGGAAVSCSTSCASGNLPAEYNKVSTSASVPVFFKVTGIPGTVALSATSTMRVVWLQ
jgi:Flp pilus assembly protein TadG